jgi:hypothetical protein
MKQLPRIAALFLITSLGACIDEAPVGTGSQELTELTDAGIVYPPPSVQVGDGPLYSGVRVGQHLILTSSRAVPFATKGSQITTGTTFAPGWYTNYHPTLALALIQRDPGSAPLQSDIDWIDLRTPAQQVGGNLWCWTHDDNYLSATVTSANSTELAISGDPFTSAHAGVGCTNNQGALVGTIDRPTGANTAVLIRAAAIAPWITQMNQLAELRIIAKQGGMVTGPFTLRVQPTTTVRMCIDIPGNAVGISPINQFACHQGKNQQFFLDFTVDASNPRIVSNQSGLCVDTPYADTGSPIALQVHPCHGFTNQRFTRQNPPLQVPNAPAQYRYRHVHALSRCMSAQTGANWNIGGLPIRQVTCSSLGGSQEQWLTQLVPAS